MTVVKNINTNMITAYTIPVFYLITVENKNLTAQMTSQCFDRFCLACSSWSIWVTTESHTHALQDILLLDMILQNMQYYINLFTYIKSLSFSNKLLIVEHKFSYGLRLIHLNLLERLRTRYNMYDHRRERLTCVSVR
jgi:hypothetical protein